MKRSKAVPASLLGAIAAATITGCSNNAPTQTRDCVDQNGRQRPDSECETGNRSSTRSGGNGVFGYPRFIYGGNYNRSSGIVTGGSQSASPQANIVTRGGTVVRGGFGSAGSGRSGFSWGG